MVIYGKQFPNTEQLAPEGDDRPRAHNHGRIAYPSFRKRDRIVAADFSSRRPVSVPFARAMPLERTASRRWGSF